jgi:N-acetylneuraminic acid mutarotase
MPCCVTFPVGHFNYLDQMRNSSYRLALLLALVCGTVATAQTGAQIWTTKGKVPIGKTDASISFAIGSTVYVGGGTGGRRFYAYDPGTATWTRKADIPGVTSQRGFGIGFSVGEHGYIGLGTDGTTLKHDLWEYDPVADTWTRKADFPGIAVDGLVTFVIGGKAYVGGGTDNTYVYSYFYEYDPSSDSWTQKDNMGIGPAVFASAFTIGSYGYVTNGAGDREYTELFRYDPSTDTWEQKADFPGGARQCGVGFTLNGKGYVGLGQTSYSSVYSDIYAYDPTTDTWSGAADFPSGRAWTTAAVADGRVFIGTGWDLASNFYDDWWELSVEPSAGVLTGGRERSGLSLYPNPVRSSLTISSDGSRSIGRITISDPAGGEVFRMEPSGDPRKLPVDISRLSPGAYILTVQSGQSVASFKIVKE